MGMLVKQQDNSFIMGLQSVSGCIEILFQAAEMFPIPIQIFSPDGVTVYANRAVLEMWNISDQSQIVGKYNLLKDPIVNDRLGLSDCIQRIFKGESMVVPDVKVPLEDFSRWYQQRDPDFSVESMYTDILNFPIRDEMNEITHIVSAFISTRMYLGKSDIARAREYIEKHCTEAFDLDKIAGIVHLSRYHFARLFKKHTGMTPYSYYQDVKIGRLKQALRDKNYSITEAFTVCGLEYSGGMARLFIQKTGMTPSQYRKSR